MGTRADFYVGRGKDAEWLGSIAMDGYPFEPGHPISLLAITDRAKYRRAVRKILREVSHATTPDQGWPWPWENSQTTDYAYAFDVGRDGKPRVYVSCFGHKWQPGTRLRAWTEDKKVEFPDMTKRQKVTMGDRSGLIVISARA
jgi:hypothetical protein